MSEVLLVASVPCRLPRHLSPASRQSKFSSTTTGFLIAREVFSAEDPGPASNVTHVSMLDDLTAPLQAAGFATVQITKHADKPCFTHNSEEMRKTMIVATKQ